MSESVAAAVVAGAAKQTKKFKDLAKSLSENGKYHVVAAPLVGTYQQGETIGATPFVKHGDKVVPGQKLCIIKAMQIPCEIKAEVEGTIDVIYGRDDQPVKYSEPILRIKLNNAN